MNNFKNKLELDDTLALFGKSEEQNKHIIHNNHIIIDAQADSYWQKCLNIISDNVKPQVFKTWFQPIKAIKWDSNQLFVELPSQFFAEWIEEHYYQLLQKTINEVIGDSAKLIYQVVLDQNKEANVTNTIKVTAFKNKHHNTQIEVENSKPFNSNLNSRYSFQNFVCGDSNQFAYSAAQAVANNPGGTKFNLLFIYGNTGLGKTHLAQAIGNHISSVNPKLKVLYISSEKFTLDFVNSIQNNSTNEFSNFYRSIDVLIVDDIQFLTGKEKTQDNFFHTFNALHQSGKQIILTSDKSPKELKDLDDRLISRFQWGLTVDVQKPDLETRMAILQKKSADEGIELPNEIIEYIATNVMTSIRELEGTLISLLAKVALDKRILNLSLAQEVVGTISNFEPKELTINEIKQTVSDFYKIPIEMMISKSRKQEIALARQMSMFIAKKLTNMSLKSLGEEFGGRDHSTVIHSCTTIENYIATDKRVKAAYELFIASSNHFPLDKNNIKL